MRTQVVFHPRDTLALSAQDDLSLVMADQGLLEQVMSILLINAINYTPPDGRITIHTHTEQRASVQ